MKLSTTIIILMTYSVVFAQRKLNKSNYQINHCNKEEFYKVSKSLIDYKKPDSSYKAAEILQDLFDLDSVSYSSKSLKALYNEIEEHNYLYINSVLNGQWIMDTIFNTNTSSHIPSKLYRISFENNYAFFYTNDSLTRKTEYFIKSGASNWPLKANLFQFVFKDTNRHWIFRLTEKSLIKSDTVFNLVVNPDPTCFCGCWIDHYRRIN